jgi:hypothetical protein
MKLEDFRTDYKECTAQHAGDYTRPRRQILASLAIRPTRPLSAQHKP